VLPIEIPDSSAIAPGGETDPPVDLRVTQALMQGRWSFGEMLTTDVREMEPNVAAMARTLALPYARVGVGLLQRADTTNAIAALDQAARLAPGQQVLVEFVRQLKAGTAR
jgi:hypothetical protein